MFDRPPPHMRTGLWNRLKAGFYKPPVLVPRSVPGTNYMHYTTSRAALRHIIPRYATPCHTTPHPTRTPPHPTPHTPHTPPLTPHTPRSRRADSAGHAQMSRHDPDPGSVGAEGGAQPRAGPEVGISTAPRGSQRGLRTVSHGAIVIDCTRQTPSTRARSRQVVTPPPYITHTTTKY